MNEEQIIEKLEHENITLATIFARAIAYSIDEIVISVLFMFSYIDGFTSAKSTEEIIFLVNSLLLQIVLMRIAYQTFFVWIYGATPGKMMMKIKVVSISDIEKPDFGISFVRSAVRAFNELFFYIGFVWAMLNPKRETWHDKAAKTLVVNA